jgi:hypothetical protein
MKPPIQPTAEVLEITLTMPETAVARFVPILGEGIFLRGPSGQTVEDFLVKSAGVSPAYLKERVQTVFLDGRALDDFGTARVMDGATLALSAAMPGLAGAVLRRGGRYAPMRRQISHEARCAQAAPGEIFVVLKLFNMIARELGPEFLRQGILVPGARLQNFWERQGRWAWEGCRAAEADGQPVNAARVVELVARRQWVRLAVRPSA